MKHNRLSVLLFLGLILVLALSACQAAPVTTSRDSSIPYPRQLNVSGNGKVYLAPDVAYVNVGVHSQAENVTDALNQNNAKAQAIANTLKELGIDEKDIQTSAFNIFPQQQFDNEGKLTGTIYMVDNVVNVTVRDLSILGKLLDAAVRSGANTINSINFDVLDKTAAITEARKLAVEDAQRQAQELAAAAGVQLGDLISMNSYASSGPAVMYDMKGGVGASGQVPVSAGQLQISVDVNLSYEIK